MAFRRDFSSFFENKRIDELDEILQNFGADVLQKVVNSMESNAFNNGQIAKWAALFVRCLRDGEDYENKPYMWYNDYADNTYIPVTRKVRELLEENTAAVYNPPENCNWKAAYFDALNPQQRAEVYKWLDMWIHEHNRIKAICLSLAEYVKKYLNGDPKIQKNTFEILTCHIDDAIALLEDSCLFHGDVDAWLQSVIAVK